MSNKKYHNYRQFETRLSKYGYWDTHISPDVPYHITYTPTLSFDISGSTDMLCNSEIFGNTVYICGSGYTENIMCMENAVPNTYCNTISGNTFNGGFYQGAYKMHGYDYDVFPDTSNGWTIEMVIRKGVNQCSGTTINDVFPDNAGMFFYWGLKQENKYCGYDISGYTSCEGISPPNPFQINEISPYDTDFLYYTSANICNGIVKKKELVFPECCDDIADNAMGFMLDDMGAISVRLFTLSGECISGQTVTTRVLSEWKSENIITDNEWKHFVIKWEPIMYDTCSKKKVGVLSFYVNSKRVFFIKDFLEFSPYPLGIDKSLQIGMPYNISIGGGTLGNMHNEFNLLMSGDTKDICKYSLQYCGEEMVTGLVISGVTYSVEPISIEEIELIKSFIELTVGREAIVKYKGKGQDMLYIEVLSEHTIDALLVDGMEVPFVESDCISFEESRQACNILKDHFTGTFIGQIDCVKIYGGALPIQAITENFKNNCAGITEEKPCC